ncbi:MAG: NAD-dependent epimerase [Frankiales bacterium]|nr:NAD-dependent epimerase [Frankiales bacterium]
MALHVIVGKGAVGTSLAAQLATAGHDVRVVSRSGGLSAGRIRHMAIDATDARALTAAANGAAALYNCANPAYHRWALDWPPLAVAFLAAAEASGAVYAITSNVYAYGPQSRPMTEDMALAATDVKGRVRADMWQEAAAWHDAGRIRAVEVRGSDFYGPGVGSQGHFGDRTLPGLLSGKRVRLLGDIDAPHSFTYVPDFARALATAAATPEMWGAAWHAPTAAALTQRQVATEFAAAAGAPAARVSSTPWLLLRTLGVAVPMLREVVEMRYQFDAPFVLDSSRSEAALRQRATPLTEGVAETVAWWRARAGAVPAATVMA